MRPRARAHTTESGSSPASSAALRRAAMASGCMGCGAGAPIPMGGLGGSFDPSSASGVSLHSPRPPHPPGARASGESTVSG